MNHWHQFEAIFGEISSFKSELVSFLRLFKSIWFLSRKIWDIFSVKFFENFTWVILVWTGSSKSYSSKYLTLKMFKPSFSDHQRKIKLVEIFIRYFIVLTLKNFVLKIIRDFNNYRSVKGIEHVAYEKNFLNQT